ncbi:efflux RND transporter periplasmic adaptor subunit [Methylophilaceae bacterium]|jgi:membrane fusion protein (multidrug efflux system)|nr:efflux RND transporter periplasmic adaptor subunit [Methylophilaceae bacterium]|tara:strand:+ start:152 stop:1423 length:1272 start_codon:yes stop_codon:yes gene_type:complete
MIISINTLKQNKIKYAYIFLVCVMAILLLSACDKKPPPPPKLPIEVSVMQIKAQDTPIDFEYVGQTESPNEVELRARVAGFLDKQVYTDGEFVSAGQIMFQMDPKPFEAKLLTAKGQLAQQQSRLEVAQATLARVIPLAAQNAVSQQTLDTVTGDEKEAQAAVIAAMGQVQVAELNLSYTTIISPISGLSRNSTPNEGAYLVVGNVLSSVSGIDPMNVNFSVSENELFSYRDNVAEGLLEAPKDSEFQVQLTLADGSIFPNIGYISFANPSFSKDTGTFLVRAVFKNTNGQLRPGQFVRAKVSGASRKNAIIVPQTAVLQGAKSHFVWVINKDNQAEQRMVEVGDWIGNDWLINDGLKAGERVVVEGAIRVKAKKPLKITELAAKAVEDDTQVQPNMAAPVLPSEKSRLNPEKSPNSNGQSTE